MLEILALGIITVTQFGVAYVLARGSLNLVLVLLPDKRRRRKPVVRQRELEHKKPTRTSSLRPAA